jgi:hypothetical protein
MDKFKLNPQNYVKDSNTPIHMSKRPRKFFYLSSKAHNYLVWTPNHAWKTTPSMVHNIGIHSHGTYRSTLANLKLIKLFVILKKKSDKKLVIVSKK